MNPPQVKAIHRQLLAYAAAPVLIAVGVVVRDALLGPVAEPESDLLLLAVAAAGLLGGLGPALLATVLGLLEEAFFHVQPTWTFAVASQRDRVELLVFVACGIAIGAAFEYVRRARQREAAVRRTLAMITRCNEAILRATVEEELYAEVCKVIVGTGGYRMCWIGVAEHDARKTVRPVAHAGHEDGYLRTVDAVWGGDPRGRGPIGTSIRERRIVVGQDVDKDPALAPWKAEALRRGYRSVTSLPILDGESALGAVAMYSGVAAAFSAEEVRLLQQLTEDVAFGVAAIRQRAALQASETRFRTYVEAAPHALFVVDGHGRFLDFNPAALEMVGVDAAKLRGMTFADLATEESREAGIEDFRRLRAIGRLEGEYELARPCGRKLWMSLRAVKLAQDRYIAFCQDVTATRRAEEALRSSEERYRGLVDGLHAGVVVHAPDTSIVLSNPTASDLLGLSTDQLRGKVAVDPDWRFVREDGTTLPPEEYPVARVVSTGRPVTNLLVGIDRPATRDRAWVLVNASPAFQASGALQRVVVTFVDVSGERKAEAERRRLQLQLAQSARLAAMGTLVAGVAHEINNPLAALTADAGTALEDVRELQRTLRGGTEKGGDRLVRRSDEILEILVDVSTSAERIARIVKDLTILGRPEQRRDRVQLADAVKGSLKWLPASVTRRAAIRMEVSCVPEVMASTSQMEQVLVNLLTNAALAFPDDRRGEIVVRLAPGTPGTVAIEVCDDGPGIAPELMERIFEPFFTTRSHGKGTGLGLSICNAIVEAHGGTLTVVSAVGQGSTFRMELPAMPPA